MSRNYMLVVGENFDVKPKDDSDFPGGNETILLVEDEEAVRAVAAEVLELSGYHVMVARNGVEGLEIYEENAASIDLLLTDVIMPNMNGQELVHHALAISPDLAVLFMSGYTDDAIGHHGVIDESVNFIQKPFTNESFLVKIREAIDCRVAASNAVH